MKTWLVLNVGSSSLKFAVWRGPTKITAGMFDRLGTDAHLTLDRAPARRVRVAHVDQAIHHLHGYLVKRNIRPDVIAHRIVHGGGAYWRPTRLTAAVLKTLAGVRDLAPLHLPINLLGVRLARRYWPNAQAWGVFDTAAFHQLPESVYLYALPLSVSRRWRIRKYGFHGISHRWALEQAAERLGRPVSGMRAVTIHLGAGDSMALWDQGRPRDTSMGFTPLEGLTMSTRSGDLDPSIPLFLLRHGYSLAAVQRMLEQQSGLFGITGLRDMRDILAAAGHPVAGWQRRSWTATQRRHARLALTMFIYDIQRYLASYLGQLERTNAIIFTGSIGQNPWIRRQILGLPAARGIRVIVIPTDEESAIAAAVRRVVD